MDEDGCGIILVLVTQEVKRTVTLSLGVQADGNGKSMQFKKISQELSLYWPDTGSNKTSRQHLGYVNKLRQKWHSEHTIILCKNFCYYCNTCSQVSQRGNGDN
eukprot:389422-Amphidinium_carterae.1